MTELQSKLNLLDESDRVRLYQELVDRHRDTSSRPVRELVLFFQIDPSFDLQDLQELVASRLPPHERPTRYIAADSLPRTSHGKIDRRGLPGLLRTDESVADTPFSGDDRLLSDAVATFRKVLGPVSVGPDTNFFELGGHSLLAVDFILKFEEKTGKRISITQFLNHPTPRGIATLLREERPQFLKYIYPVSEKLTGLPVFIFSASELAYLLKSHREDWTVYGVQMRWQDDANNEISYPDLEALASRIAAEIRQVSSRGDFVLAGSSFPAVVAFEVARQLRAAGRTPRLTILVEPTFFSGFRHWVERDLQAQGHLREGDNHILKWLVVNNPLRPRFWFRSYRFLEINWARILARRSARRNAPDAQTPDREGVDRKAIDKANLTSLWRKYRPTSGYSGPVVLMVGNYGWRYDREWRKLFDDERTVHRMTVAHLDILTEPFMSTDVLPVFCAEVDTAVGRIEEPATDESS